MKIYTTSQLINLLGWNNLVNEIKVILNKINESVSSIFTDAPSDGKIYGRKDGEWISSSKLPNYNTLVQRTDTGQIKALDAVEADDLLTLGQFSLLSTPGKPIKLVDSSLGDYTFVLGDEKKVIWFVHFAAGAGDGIITANIPSGVFQEGDVLETYVVNIVANSVVTYALEGGFQNIGRLLHVGTFRGSTAIIRYLSAGQSAWTFTYYNGLSQLTATDNYANDSIAAANGVDIGEQYHTAGVVKVRLT